MDKFDLYWDRMLAVDSALCVTVSQSNQYRLIRNLFRAVSRLGDGVFWYTLMILMVLTQQDNSWVAVLHMALAAGTGTLTYKWLKAKTLRPRPYQVRQDVLLGGKALDHFSFPSGHTLHAVVFGVVAMVYYPALSVLLVPFIVLVGLSRVILGLHYPSDVLVGASIGYVIAQLSFMLKDYII